MKRIFISLITCSLFFCSMNAQIHFHANVANNHLWRGMEVADGMVFTSDISITDKNEYFRIGLWGGTNTSGTYKEFNHYVSFLSPKSLPLFFKGYLGLKFNQSSLAKAYL